MKTETKTNKWDLIKLKSFCTDKKTINKPNDNPWKGRKYLQRKWLTRDCSPKSTNSSCSSTSKKKKEKKNQIQKWAEDLNDMTFLHRRHTNGQKAHEKMLNITDYERNADQNHNDLSPHTGQNDHHNKINKWMLKRMGEKGTLLHCW